MSASDAKESIRQGGSLKERMAALQGRGGFSGPPPPPTAPKPQLKPKSSTPSVTSPPVDSPGDAPERVKSPEAASVKSAGAESVSEADAPSDAPPPPPTDQEAEAVASADAPAEEDDEEEKERQRRAAIAQRMARLGGARVGMAPIFGKPTPPPKRRSEDSGEGKHVCIA